jgi:hypothetical protein
VHRRILGTLTLEDLVLEAQRARLTPQRHQLLALGRAHTVLAALIDIGLRQPVPQAAIGDPELLGDV